MLAKITDEHVAWMKNALLLGKAPDDFDPRKHLIHGLMVLEVFDNYALYKDKMFNTPYECQIDKKNNTYEVWKGAAKDVRLAVCRAIMETRKR